MGIERYVSHALCSAVLLLQLMTLSPTWALIVPELYTGDFAVRSESLTITPSAFPATALFTDSNFETTSYQSVVFVGDILLARNVEVLMQRYGNDYPFKHFVPSALASHPLVIGNFEASVPVTHSPTPSGNLAFSVATTALSTLSNAGFSLLSLANNHSLDFGEEMYIHTRAALKTAALDSFGHGAIVQDTSIATRVVDGKTIAFIAIHALVPLELPTLETTFEQARRISDFQVVYVHWGEEYALRQSDDVRNLAQQFIRLGADLIVGHHPHVTQGIEVIDGVLVFYSLGNFIFDQYFSTDVQQGLVVTLEFSPEPLLTLVPYTSMNALSQPQPMPVSERQQFLSFLSERSDPQLTEQIMNSRLPLPTLFATSPKMAIINQ